MRAIWFSFCPMVAICIYATIGCNAEEQQPRPSMDSGATPSHVVELRVDSPEHLVSNVPQDVEVYLDVSHQNERADALALIKMVAEIRSIAGVKIQGVWQSRSEAPGSFNAAFKANDILVKGDYTISFAANKLVKAPADKSRFYVGSMPRIQYIQFKDSNSKGGLPTKLDIIELRFSEMIDPSKANVNVESLKASAWTKVANSKTTVSTSGNWVILNTANYLALSDKLRIKVAKDVGAKSSVLLDGNYKGVAGVDFEEVIDLNGILSKDGARWSPSI